MKHPVLRLTVVLFVILMIVMGSLFLTSHHKSKQKAIQDAVTLARLNTSLGANIVQDYLAVVEVAANCLTASPISRSHEQEEIYRTLEQFVRVNPNIWGAAVGYEPGVIHNTGDEGFAAFVRNADGMLKRFNLPKEGVLYREADWYAGTVQNGESRWSRAFKDVRGAMIASYCIPLKDRRGKIFGVLAVDIQLNSFSKMLTHEIHPYENAVTIVLDGYRTIIAHPEEQFLMMPVTEAVKQLNAEYGTVIPENLLASKAMSHDSYYTISKEDLFQGIILHAPVVNTGWSVAMIVMDKDIFAEAQAMSRQMLLLWIFGIVFLAVIIVIVFKQLKIAVVARATVDRELQTASRIQMSILKKSFPKLEQSSTIDLHAMIKPAKDVGGDFYDYVLSEETLNFCIGDVSGKGVPASLFMALSIALYRSISLYEKTPAAIAKALNNALSKDNSESIFVTMFLGSINLRTGVITFCNCGHNAPAVNAHPNGRMASIDGEQMPEIEVYSEWSFITSIPTNIPVGIIPDYEYKETKMLVTPGCQILLYTDGVTEAESRTTQLYGEQRLKEVLNRMHGLTMEQKIGIISQSVQAHASGAKQSDDMTMLMVKYLNKNN